MQASGPSREEAPTEEHKDGCPGPKAYNTVELPQEFNLENLIKYVKQSPYLYDSKNKLFENTNLRYARWAEIGAYFHLDGERVCRHWVKTVVRYRNVLRRVLVVLMEKPDAKIANMHEFRLGAWFDRVGELVGLTLENILKSFDRHKTVEENFEAMYKPLRDSIH